MPFFVQAYRYLYLVLNCLVFQKSSRVVGGRFSSMYIGVSVSSLSGMMLEIVMLFSGRFLNAFL